MKCSHVLGLIDAGPFAEYPRAHLEAARDHARRCATCGPALAAANALKAGLAALPQVAAPADVAGRVLARIARLDEARSARDAEPAAQAAPREFLDWSAWVPAAGGLAAVVAALLTLPTGAWGPTELLSPRLFGTTGRLATAVPPSLAGALALGGVLVVYLAGLFSPLSSTRRR